MYEVYGKEDCGFCKRAVEILNTTGSNYIYKTLGVDYERECLVKKTGEDRLTYPRVFKDGVLVGGYTELLDTLI